MCLIHNRSYALPALLLVMHCIDSAAVARAPLTITLRNTAALETSTTDQFAATFPVTGLSGIARSDANHYLAVMDNSSKLVRIDISLAADGTITSAALTGGITLALTRDFEGIAAPPPSPGTAPASVFLSEEDTPGIVEVSLASGALLQTLTTPSVFLNRRPNFGFESLAAGPGAAAANSASELWTANEEALTVDGPQSTTSAGSLIRLLRFSGGPGAYAPVQQFAYLTAPIHGTTTTGSRSGVSDIVALPDGRIITLERSLALTPPGFFQSRIYEISFTGATEISAIPSLSAAAPGSFTTVTKTLLWSGSQQNLEGLCLGPSLGAGRYALLGIVDDADPLSVNQVVSFDLSGVGLPSCAGDTNADGQRNTSDLTLLLARFGQSTVPGDRSDINNDGVINTLDLTQLLAGFGTPCP